MATPRVMRQAARALTRTAARAPQNARFQYRLLAASAVQSASCTRKWFSSSVQLRAGLMPDTEDPQPPSKVDEDRPTQPTQLDDEEYQTRSDAYMDAIHEKAEEIQEGRDDVEVEYAAGVLSITLPPNGTYVINKQPPNKQIWLSSPTSGPKRYDWVVDGESMHEKEGGGQGDWVYLRDGSSLTELLRKELQITVDLHGDEDSLKPTVDPTE